MLQFYLNHITKVCYQIDLSTLLLKGFKYSESGIRALLERELKSYNDFSSLLDKRANRNPELHRVLFPEFRTINALISNPRFNKTDYARSIFDIYCKSFDDRQLIPAFLLGALNLSTADHIKYIHESRKIDQHNTKALSEGFITGGFEEGILKSLPSIDDEGNNINLAKDAICALIAAASLDCDLYLGPEICIPIIKKLSRQCLINSISPVSDWFHNLHSSIGLNTKKSMYEFIAEKTGDDFDTVKQRFIRWQKGTCLPSIKELDDLFSLIARAPEEYMALHLMHGVSRATMLIAKILEEDEEKDLKYTNHMAAILKWRQKLLGPWPIAA